MAVSTFRIFWEVRTSTPVSGLLQERGHSLLHTRLSFPERKSKSNWRPRLDTAQERAECICCVEWAENRRGGCAAGKVLLSALKRGDHTGTDRSGGQTMFCFCISSSAPRNPPHPTGSAEAHRRWIISSPATNLLCSTGEILPSWWGLLLNQSTS